MNIIQVIVMYEVEVVCKIVSCVIYMENGYIVEYGDVGCFVYFQIEVFKNYFFY